jgi:hypothetical protein
MLNGFNISKRRCAVAACILTSAAAFIYAEERLIWSTGANWPEPKVVMPAENGAPPSDAIVLFDGKDFSAWNGAEKWTIKDGYAICAGQDLRTKQSFGDCQLHIEWQIPANVKGRGQGRGNSGVFLFDLYEVQVMDSYENKTYFDGQAGSIYKQHPPLVNACRKPGEWQSYDIIFKAPRFNDKGELLSPAYMTVLHNGVLVQDHFEILGHTNYRKQPRYDATPPKMPIRIQYHNVPVYYRNIWVRELPDSHEELLQPFRDKLKSQREQP